MTDVAGPPLDTSRAAPAEPAITVEHRAALVYLLREAAELEHGLMCEYLFAAFSLKQREDEGLTAEQLAAVDRWRKAVYGIAAQEMLHLALVNNLLVALGAAPHFSRPNLPQRARHYPAGVQLALLPFGERALRHFLYLERPEGMALDDAEGFRALDVAQPLMRPDEIAPRGQEFATVGHLYRAIEHGLERLTERYGQEWVFVGPTRAQITGDYFWWPELVAVIDLASARTAIETIITEGEGARGDWRDAHFGRFLAVFTEYQRLRAADPSFEPARPAVAATVQAPVDTEAGAAVTDPHTAATLDVFNVAYEILLQVLERFFAHTSETDAQLHALADVAVELMTGVLEPLGTHLTTLPLAPGTAAPTAGPSFQLFYGSGYLLPHRRAAWVLLHERMLTLGAYWDRTCGATTPASARATLDRLAARLAEHEPALAGRRVAG